MPKLASHSGAFFTIALKFSPRKKFGATNENARPKAGR
ncbi:hypothetical protein VO64_2936 [Pseudomonas synxantha]|uniref:Uncharacterized protein n=1 Tax=Pseudomonas synxantha TaxID=47883 RepID=A0AAU8TZ87_9PSED|nr:hypothetical protein VO64_2936 [Pseudomonas synxantha]